MNTTSKSFLNFVLDNFGVFLPRSSQSAFKFLKSCLFIRLIFVYPRSLFPEPHCLQGCQQPYFRFETQMCLQKAWEEVDAGNGGKAIGLLGYTDLSFVP